MSVTSVPSKKSSIKPGDRVLEINGVQHTDFKDEKTANDLFNKTSMDVIPAEESESESESDSE